MTTRSFSDLVLSLGSVATTNGLRLVIVAFHDSISANLVLLVVFLMPSRSTSIRLLLSMQLRIRSR